MSEHDCPNNQVYPVEQCTHEDCSPSTTGSREKAMPEKVWLNPHEFFEDDDETAIAFLAHPQQGELLWQSGIRTYYSESALSQARAEARAAGYAEALAKFKHQGTDGCASCYTGRVDYYVTNRKCIQCDPEAYQPARSSAGAEEGEER